MRTMKLRTFGASLVLKRIIISILFLAVILPLRNITVVHAGENSWTSLGLYGATILDIAISPGNSDVIYATTSGQNWLLKSTDGGKIWQSILNSSSATSGSKVLFDPIIPDTIYVVSAGDVLHTSRNAGSSWESKPISFPGNAEGGTSVYTSTISPVDGVLYIGTGQGIFRSIDKGDTWERPALPPSSQEIHAIAVAPSAPHIVYAGGLYSLLKSLDGGTTWQKADGGFAQPPSYVYSITVDPYDAQVVYIGTGDNGIFRSSNGGQSWLSIGAGLSTNCIRAILINPGNQQVIYVGGGTPSFFPSTPGTPGVYQSLDNVGGSWAPMTEGMGSKAIRSMAISGGTFRTIFAGTEGNGIWKYMITSDTRDFSISINHGSLYTNQLAVTLHLSAPSGTSEMIISNDGGFSGATWEAYTTQKSWIITGYGNYIIPRIVYVKFKTNGKISGLYQDDIILDQTPPTGSINISSTSATASTHQATAGSKMQVEPFNILSDHSLYLPIVGKRFIPGLRTVGLQLSAVDDFSGVDNMLISNRSDFAGAKWQGYAQRLDWFVEDQGTTTVHVKYRDRAGNESLVYSASTSGP